MTKLQKAKKPLEKEIQKAILKKLWDLGVFAWRNNSGMMPASYKGVTRMIQFGASGSPDIIAILNGFFLGVEVKRPGNSQNEAQKAFQKNIEGAGGYYILATSPEELEEKINLIKKNGKR